MAAIIWMAETQAVLRKWPGKDARPAARVAWLRQKDSLLRRIARGRAPVPAEVQPSLDLIQRYAQDL